MRCCRSDWAGLCLFCFLNLCVLSANRVDFGLFLSLIFQVYSPPPQDTFINTIMELFYVSQLRTTIQGPEIATILRSASLHGVTFEAILRAIFQLFSGGLVPSVECRSWYLVIRGALLASWV